MQTPISKTANAVLRPGGGADFARDHSSMMWVGGRVTLDGDFEAYLHPAFGTSIIEIVLSDGTQMGLRCWGAARLLEQIEAARPGA